MFRLAWKYVLYHKLLSLLLVCGLTLVIAFPLVAWRSIAFCEDLYTRRAAQTPLLVGRKANAYQLVLNTLYFHGPRPAPLPQKVVRELRRQRAGVVIPISNRLTAGNFPVIGTVPEYYAQRGLAPREGTLPLLLGDCAVGSAAARELGLKAGDGLLTDISSFLNLAHEYQFKLYVAGVLAPSGSADDRAVFVDLKTAWTVEGLGHGHENVVDHSALPGLGSANSEQVQAVLGKGVSELREVTAENIGSFHFHGDMEEYPVTAVIVVPDSAKSGTMLKGALNTSDEHEAVVPSEIIHDLLRIVFNVKRVFDSYFAMTALATFAFLAIVVLLSLRGRREEFDTMVRMGCSSNAIARLFLYQFLILLTASAAMSLLIAEGALYLLRHYVL